MSVFCRIKEAVEIVPMSLPSLGLDSLAECSVFLLVPFYAGFLCFAEGTLFSANESLDVNCYPWQLITAGYCFGWNMVAYCITDGLFEERPVRLHSVFSRGIFEEIFFLAF